MKEELAKIKARNMERRAQKEAEARAAVAAERAEAERKSSRSWWPWCEYHVRILSSPETLMGFIQHNV